MTDKLRGTPPAGAPSSAGMSMASVGTANDEANAAAFERSGPEADDPEVTSALEAAVHYEQDVPPALRWYTQQHAVFTGGNRVELMTGGDMLFPAMLRAIEGARHQIWLATYIYHRDDQVQSITNALIAAARRGVHVRLVVDGFGTGENFERLKAEFAGSGVHIAVFRPTRGWRSVFQPEQFRRLHHKLCVVDDTAGFVGGINLIDDRIDPHHGTSELPRLDFAVRLSGPVIGPIEQTVRAIWLRARLGHDLRDQLADVARKPQSLAQAKRLFHQLNITRWAGMDSAIADRRPVRAAFVVRDNLRQRRTIERSYVGALRRSRHRIDIVSPYFYPGRAFRRALTAAADRGVQVRLLLQGKLDYRIAGYAAFVLYDEMFAHGVRIFEYTPAFLHAKVAVVDHDWATVGSSNIDPLSLLLNLEANVIVRDARFNAQLSAAIEHAIGVSTEVIPPQTPARSGWAAVRRGFVAFVAGLYLKVAGFGGRY
ncbi:MAG: ybhO [Rhizobacter sp.]|nr:ybhO [Rhizobacter sp.]